MGTDIQNDDIGGEVEHAHANNIGNILIGNEKPKKAIYINEQWHAPMQSISNAIAQLHKSPSNFIEEVEQLIQTFLNQLGNIISKIPANEQHDV